MLDSRAGGKVEFEFAARTISTRIALREMEDGSRGVVAVWSGGNRQQHRWVTLPLRSDWSLQQPRPFFLSLPPPLPHPVGVHGGLSDSGWLCMVARYAMTTPRENREVNTDTESKKIQRWSVTRKSYVEVGGRSVPSYHVTNTFDASSRTSSSPPHPFPPSLL